MKNLLMYSGIKDWKAKRFVSFEGKRELLAFLLLLQLECEIQEFQSDNDVASNYT